MSRRTRFPIFVLFFAGLPTVAGSEAVVAASPPTGFVLVRLIDGASPSFEPGGISANGTVAGSFPNDNGFYRAVTVDAAGQRAEISPAGLIRASFGVAINRAGTAIGWGYDSNLGPQAFVKRPGLAPEVLTLPGIDNPRLTAIGSDEAVAGYGNVAADGHLAAFVYRANQLKIVPTLGTDYNEPIGLADDGTLALNAVSPDSSINGYRYASDALHSLTIAGNSGSRVEAIDTRGRIVGTQFTSDGSRAFVAEADGTTLNVLPMLTAAPRPDVSYAYGLNEEGFIVGESFASSALHAATLWRPDGSVIDLDKWLDVVDPAAGAMFHLTQAVAINDDGWIVGYADYAEGGIGSGGAGGRAAFVLNAQALVPEPALGAVLGLMWLARRQIKRSTMPSE